jgi:glutamate--cysteine ligase
VTDWDADAAALHDRAAAETYIASVCFKHGPPRRLGVELEWTVHDVADPSRRLDASRLAAALGDHAPTTLVPGSPSLPLPGGSLVTVEPGGQVELSSPPRGSLAELLALVTSDMVSLTERLAGHGLRFGSTALDPHRPPRRLLNTPRYAAMQNAFDQLGPDGIAMMCSTAGLQVCVDVGEPDRLTARWAAVHALGPVLSAVFANSPGTRRGLPWSSARLRACLGTDPARSRPSGNTADPAASWARRVLDAPLVCVRRPDGSWDVPGRVTFAEWMAGGLPGQPTTDDLDYHLSTMFPPVRPRGYLELRYLDAQHRDGWIEPVVLLSALLAKESTVDAVLAAAAPAAGRWLSAARYGLADPCVGKAAQSVLELGLAAIEETDLDRDLIESVGRGLTKRMGGVHL